MNEYWDEEDDLDDYDDDPTGDYPEVNELMIQLLETHRQTPDQAAFLLLPGISIEAIDAAYRDLNANGLMEYTEELVTVGDERRHTLRLTLEGL